MSETGLLGAGSILVGDLLVQGLFFLILAAAVVGVVSFFITSRKKKDGMDRIEEKLDLLIQEWKDKK